MSLKPIPPLALSLRASGEFVGQPLPAEEQLAQILRLAGNGALPHGERSGVQPNYSLQEAYLRCKQVTRDASKSFFFSSQLLPREKRHSVRALYAFCRTTDDIVDNASDDPTLALAEWVCQVRAPAPPADDPVLLAWHDTRSRYDLSHHLVDELLAGVAMDLTISRYVSFADLWLYCYRVASVVGLLSMGITGSAVGAEPYAIKLGVALQLTNILRDIGEDARRGRIYVPMEDIERFGLSADDILAGVQDERFKALMRFEIQRTRQLYAESWPGIALLPPDSRLAIAAAARVYRGILDKVEANNYDVYAKRAHLKSREKLFMLPRIWRDVQRLKR